MHKAHRVKIGLTLAKRSIRQKITKTGTGVALFVAIIGLTVTPLVAAYGNNDRVVYDNTPSRLPGNVPSLGYEATSTSEFGSQVKLAGDARNNPTINVVMSSWACKSGTWQANCITNPGSTFTHPVTLNLYTVNPDNTVGTVIASQTQTFTMPYRPTTDDGTNCNTGNGKAGEWWDGKACNNGVAFTISFSFSSTTLPDQVIAAVAYNTSDYGVAPLGHTTACSATTQGCPYDSLNVGTNPTPTVGQSLPSNDTAYVSSTYAGSYSDSGAGGTGTLRVDTGWAGYLPAIQITASKSNDHYRHQQGGDNWNHPGQRDNKYHNTDGGRRGSYWNKQSSFFSLSQN